jgi:hypothetical protein
VRRPQFEHHLILVAKVDSLEKPALGETPEIEVVAEAAPEDISHPISSQRRKPRDCTPSSLDFHPGDSARRVRGERGCWNTERNGGTGHTVWS